MNIKKWVKNADLESNLCDYIADFGKEIGFNWGEVYEWANKNYIGEDINTKKQLEIILLSLSGKDYQGIVLI